jgi:hypothetical protein
MTFLPVKGEEIFPHKSDSSNGIQIGRLYTILAGTLTLLSYQGVVA